MEPVDMADEILAIYEVLALRDSEQMTVDYLMTQPDPVAAFIDKMEFIKEVRAKHHADALDTLRRLKETLGESHLKLV